MTFQPRAAHSMHPTAWWQLSPRVIQQFIAVLGFEDARVTYHFQLQEGAGKTLFFTVVGRRTVPLV
jgi:hypothetical protein